MYICLGGERIFALRGVGLASASLCCSVVSSTLRQQRPHGPAMPEDVFLPPLGMYSLPALFQENEQSQEVAVPVLGEERLRPCQGHAELVRLVQTATQHTTKYCPSGRDLNVGRGYDSPMEAVVTRVSV